MRTIARHHSGRHFENGPSSCCDPFGSFIKTACRLVALASCLWIAAACAPRSPAPPLPPPAEKPAPTIAPAPEVESADRLFSTAESFSARKAYPQAVDAYRQYLDRFPDDPRADLALIRLGRLQVVLENYPDARRAYNRLIEQYPGSPRVSDARIELLAVAYKTGQYEALIAQASALPEDSLSEVQIIRKELLCGDALLALNVPVEAFARYARALAVAPPAKKEPIADRLKNAASRIDSAGILYLLGQLPDSSATAYLLYQLGLNRIADQRYRAAVVILSSIVENFPDHEMAGIAQDIIAELERTVMYDRYTIGCLLPLSGRYQAYGRRALRAIELALSRFGQNGREIPFKVIVKDTAADPDKTIRGLNELAEKKVAAVIGPLIHVEPAAELAQAKEIPIITLTQKDRITEIGDYVFRNFFTPRMQVASIVSYAVNQLGLTRFAILYPGEHYGTTYMNLFWDEVIAHGGIVTGVESYDPTQTDFANPIKKIVGLYYAEPESLKTAIDLIAERFIRTPDLKEEPQVQPGKRGAREDEPAAIVDFEAVFIPDAPKTAGLIIPQLAFYDINDVYLLGTNLWNSKTLIDMARPYVQAAIIPDGFFAGSHSTPVKAFVEQYKNIFGADPGFIDAIAYDTARILMHAMTLPDVRTRAGLMKALIHLKNFEGITGLTAFDETGDVKKQLYLLRIRGDEFIEIDRR